MHALWQRMSIVCFRFVIGSPICSACNLSTLKEAAWKNEKKRKLTLSLTCLSYLFCFIASMHARFNLCTMQRICTKTGWDQAVIINAYSMKRTPREGHWHGIRPVWTAPENQTLGRPDTEWGLTLATWKLRTRSFHTETTCSCRVFRFGESLRYNVETWYHERLVRCWT